MSSETPTTSNAPRNLQRLSGYLLWGLVLLAGGYTWWKSSTADDGEDRAAPSNVAEDDRQPIELQPTIDGQRVSLAPPGSEVATNIPLPDFELTNQFGETVTLGDLKGRPWVASFIFSRCAGACPMLMKRLHDLRLELGDADVRFVSITVDPEHDTVAQLRQYGEIFGATDDNWWLLTGDKEAIYNLILNGFEVVAQENYGADRLPGFEFAHTAGLIHIDAEGRMIGKYESGQPEEVITLRRVLTGAIETPEEHLIRRVVVPDETDSEEDDAAQASAEDADKGTLPPWLARLPMVNAGLNSLATVLLVAGYTAIMSGARDLHKNLMLTAFAVSIAFLVCYLTYHFGRHHYLGSASAKFAGTGTIRSAYLSILVTHILLAAAVPVLAIATITQGLRKKWESHKRWANLTFPIWLYVSVTGVVIYLMNSAHGAYDV